MKLVSPLNLATLAFVIAILLVAPWGNFPVNDDWCFAHLAKQLAETGKFIVDVPIAPSTIGQSLFLTPFIKLFGFSHTLLRVVTLALSWVLLWSVSKLLKWAKVQEWLQTMVLVFLALNPLYMNLSASFMTEIYGWSFALLGAVLWFWRRERNSELAWPTALAVALWVGGTFWVRQFAVVVFPALLGSYVLGIVLGAPNRPERLKRELPKLLAATLLFCAVVLVYFPWAKAIGAFRPELARPMSGLAHLQPKVWFLHLGVLIVYMTWFFYPLLILGAGPGWIARFASKRGMRFAGAFFLIALLISLVQVFKRTSGTLHHDEYLNRIFPFMSNVLYGGGIGPITFTDIYIYDQPQPLVPAWIWVVVQSVLIALCALWVPIVAATPKLVKNQLGGIRREIASFGLLLAAGSVFLVWQAYATSVFDRYYLPCLLGLGIALPVLFDEFTKEGARPTRRTWLAYAALVLPMAFYTVAGVHDYFCWNDARWQLFREAVESGTDPQTIDGGYEVDGWALREPLPGSGKGPCIGGRCHCRGVWWDCHDASYRIGMNLMPGYQEVRSLEPGYWLTKGKPILLSKRVSP